MQKVVAISLSSWVLVGCPDGNKPPHPEAPSYPADYQTDVWESMEKGEKVEDKALEDATPKDD